MKICPLCGSKEAGLIGPERYYCWSCLLEYDEDSNLYEVLEDGSVNKFEVSEPYL